VTAIAGERPVAGGVLRAVDVSKRFGGIQALRHASIEVTPGTATALIGPNGAGKSTLIGILSGRTRTDTGSLSVDGAELSFGSPREAIAFGIHLIPQELLAAKGLSVAENLLLGRYPRTGIFFDRRRLVAKAQAIADEGGLDVDVRSSVDGLSPAQLRLMMIAKATSSHCRFLIMDEPTASLSAREVERIGAAIRRLRERGVGVLYVSHRLGEVTEFCQELVVLRDGALTHTGSMADVSVPRLVELMSDVDQVTQAAAAEAAPAAAADPGKVLLEARDLGRGRVAGISLEVRAGEVVGLAGLVGSGRTETIRLLVGADRATSGELYWHGQRVTRPSVRAAIGQGIVLLPEDRRGQGGFQDLAVSDNVALPSLPRFSWACSLLRRGPENRAVTEVLHDVEGTAGRLRSPLRVLSGGNQQKALIAKWLLTRPRVFAFDEPTAGIDVHAKEAIRQQLRRLAREGAGVIVASSDNDEIPGLCDRVVVLREGCIAGELTGPEIRPGNLVALSYGQGRTASA
jgi:ABC-type sugar transport system ATPase subunit